MSKRLISASGRANWSRGSETAMFGGEATEVQKDANIVGILGLEPLANLFTLFS